MSTGVNIVGRALKVADLSAQTQEIQAHLDEREQALAVIQKYIDRFPQLEVLKTIYKEIHSPA